jgi:hypothetical protein
VWYTPAQQPAWAGKLLANYETSWEEIDKQCCIASEGRSKLLRKIKQLELGISLAFADAVQTKAS